MMGALEAQEARGKPGLGPEGQSSRLPPLAATDFARFRNERVNPPEFVFYD